VRRELDEPGGVPAGDDGLTVGMAVRVVIQAPAGARLGVTAWPDARITSVPRRQRCGRGARRGCDAPFQPRQIHGSRVERIVDTPPAAPTTGRQTQMRWGFEGWGGQHRVEQLEQGIAPAPKGSVYVLTEGSERFPFWCVHIQNDALSSLSLSPPPQPTPCC
jgi:hypothetical protein